MKNFLAGALRRLSPATRISRVKLKKSPLKAVLVLLVLCFSSLAISQASANTTTSCGTSGTFTISNNVVTGNSSCAGTVTVPEGVTSIAASAFQNANLVEGVVTLPSTLQTIGASAFYRTGRISVVIPRSVYDIGSQAFWESNIISLTFETPSSLTQIRDSVIRYTNNLKTLTIPEGVTSLANLAIAGPNPLRSISLPSTINSINSGAFTGTVFACVANPGNSTFINNFAFTAGPVNFPASTNAFATAPVKRVANISDCADQPTITSLGTTSGTTVGGTNVVINGTNLSGTRAVKFGTFNATVISSTSTTATVVTTAAVGTTLSNLSVHLVADGGWVTSPVGVAFTYNRNPNKVAVDRAVPIASVSNGVFRFQPRLTIQDAVGNTVTSGTGSAFQVTATVSAGATLTGTQTATASAGVATFTNLGITGEGGETYTITFSSDFLTPATQTVRIARICDGVRFDCEVGDIGPGGGTIFYVAPEFFTQTGATAGMCTTECKYLEAAPSGWGGATDPIADWSNNTTTSTVQDSTTGSNQSSIAAEKVNWKIGQGFYNTSVMKVSGATTAIRDSVVAYSGTSARTAGQWFLPSVNELNELCKWSNNLLTGNLKTSCVTDSSRGFMPGFVSFRYWSSSEATSSNAWHVRFSSVLIDNIGKSGDVNGNDAHFRPIRAFGATPIYEITLRSGANGVGSAQTLDKTRGTNLTLPNSATANGYFTRTGFTVTGWSTSDGGAKTHDLGGVFTTEANTSLYPVWTGNTLTVTYDTKGGSNIDTSSTVSGGSVSSAPNRPTRTGYTFAGWSATNGGVVIAFPYTHGSTSNFTLHALWIADTYTITYINNGATGSPSATTATYTTGGTAVTLPTVGTMVKTGFDFGGWSTTPTGTAHAGTYTTTVDRSLWAVWTIKSLSVTYSEGTATRLSLSNFPSNTSGDYGTTITLSSNITATTTISGITHEFTGWSDGASIYRGGSSYVLGENSPTFTAIWTKIFAVRYSFNGGTPAIGDFQTDSECLAAGNTCTDGQQIVANEAPYRAGYNFAGWVDQNNISVATGSAFTVSASRYLIYANWAPIDYTISYNAAGGSAAANSFTKQKGQSFTLAGELSKTGYAFDGWNDGQSTFGAGTVYYVDAFGVTLTAQWRANTYIVSFDWNGSTGSSTTPVTYTVGGNALTLPPVGDQVKDGYGFVGWSTSINGSKINNSFTPSSNGTLYAIWEAVLSGTTDSQGSNDSGSSTPGTVFKVPPVKVIGARDAKVITVIIGMPSEGSSSSLKVDLASEKSIASVKIVNGNLVLTPKRGYSGIRTVTVTITEYGAARNIEIPLTVLPESVKKPVITRATNSTSRVKWSKSPNAKMYSVYLNSQRVCFTSKTSCTIKKSLGPSSVVNVSSNGADRTVSKKVRARFQR